MKTALTKLIDDLSQLESAHDEITDTAVREAMYIAIHHALIVPKVGYKLPKQFAMFTREGNDRVKKLLHNFLTAPEVLASAKTSKTAKTASTFSFSVGYLIHKK